MRAAEVAVEPPAAAVSRVIAAVYHRQLGTAGPAPHFVLA